MSNKPEADPLGDEVKALEAAFERRVAEPGQFLMARADGRAFHTFTKGMRKPFDPAMSNAMQYTARNLAHMFNARLAYTQSDEITLCFYYPADGTGTDYPYGGRLQKLCSLIAAQASVLFYARVVAEVESGSWPESKLNDLPVFDCRVFRALTYETVLNSFIWREKDARKNAVSMAASAHYTEKQLNGVSTGDRLKLLREAGVTFNDYPQHFRAGMYFYRRERTVPLDAATLAKIPEGKAPPDGMVTRRSVEAAEFATLLEASPQRLMAIFGLEDQSAVISVG